MKTTIRIFAFCAVLLALMSGLFLSCSSTPPSGSGTESSATARSGTPRQQPSRMELDRQAAYMRVLRDRGYLPDVDSDGDIVFEHDGRNYYVLIGNSDPTLMILLLPNIISVDNRDTAARAISTVGRKTKVAKAFFAGSSNQYISLSLELFLEDEADFESLFSRMLRILDQAEEHLRNEL